MVNKMNKIFLWLITWMFFVSGLAHAGPYTDSAHGNNVYGVKRSATGFPADYAKGHCANCHEQHSSINGSEPYPDGGSDNYLLFDTSHTSQTANFCFDCHTDTASQQSGGYIKNYSYAYRAGNYDDSAGNDDIKQAFDNTSSHNLDDIRTFITGKWGYTSNSNPCYACHNSHIAQGDPADSTSPKSSLTRGYPVSRPSDHFALASWGLWGNEPGEKMSNYTSYYQAPYRFGETTSYEPDGSTTIMDGSNLTDYVTFCLDCHYTYQPQSTLLGALKVIDWETSVHGKADSWKQNDADERKAPYKSESVVNRNYVLACTDCHEPHGSNNYCYLIRKEVNGDAVAVADNTRNSWNSLCSQCHTQSHVEDDDANKKNDSCITCHYHGAIDGTIIKPLF